MTTAKAPSARLDKLLSSMGYASRKEIAWLVRSGRIKLDGEPLSDAGQRLLLTDDLPQRLRINGQALDPLPGLVIVMNKPAGVTCSHRDEGPLVYEVLPSRWRLRKPPISTIGRLDKDTTGLLLMTDDGTLLHRAISPKSNLEKRYRARLARPLRGDEAEILAAGSLLLDSETTPLLPVAMRILGAEDATEPMIEVRLTEGRYHQVRRMFAALGNHVLELHRDAFGGLELPDDLASGEFRLLTSAEIARIFGER